MGSQGPLSPASATQQSPGSPGWGNFPAGITSSDNAYASAAFSAASEGSLYLVAYNFGFTIPTDAVITGIVVEIERHSGSTNPDTHDDKSVMLAKGLALVGSDKAQVGFWPVADAYAAYGSSSDLWGTTWTPAEINNNDGFGVGIRVRSNSGITARIDHIRITVHYAQPPAAPAVTSPNGGETIDASHNITWTAATDPDTPQANLQYHIQFTRDNGATWADVVALTAAGATSHNWNTSAIAGSSQCRVRIRAWDGSVFGPFDESNANFTIQHNVAPNAPSLTPRSNFDATQSAQFQWTFSDPDAGATQSAYQLVITRVSDGATIYDSGKVAGAASAHTLPASTLANGVAYQWKVRTWDNLDTVGPYSALGSFSTSAKPSVTITDPAADQAVIGSSQHTVAWSFSDPESAGQSAFQVKVKDNLAVTQYDSGKVLDVDDRAHLIQNLPNNANDWTIELTVWDAADVASSTAIRIFDVSFTPPAPANLTVTPEQLNGRTVLAWTNHNEPTKYQAESSTLGTGAAIVADAGAEGGSAVALDAQNEYVERQHTPAATARHRFKARVRDSAQVANDVRLEILRVSDSAIIASQTFTGAAAYGELSLAADLTVNVAYRFRVTKATATVNTITVDWLVVEVFTLTTSNDIYRRKTGAGTWERIAKDQALNSTYNDYTAASGQSYDYKVTAKAANATATDSSVVAGTLTLTGVWLHDPAAAATTIKNFVYDGEGKDEAHDVSVALHQFAGRTEPVAEFGDESSDSVSVKLGALRAGTDVASLKSLIDRRATLCYRDGRGRKLFGVVPGHGASDEVWGAAVGFKVQGIAYSEAV